jgi:hypothetical protein
MSDFSLILPPDFDDYAFEVEAKGWFEDAVLVMSSQRYRLCFYDPVRLSQEISSDVSRSGMFHEANLVVVQSVTKECMLKAAEKLAKSRMLDGLAPEKT